jgi:hypothetical protein
MFEIGYAIAANKRIWLIRDETYYDAKKEFEQLRLSTTIGYSPHVNSEQICVGAATARCFDRLAPGNFCSVMLDRKWP